MSYNHEVEVYMELCSFVRTTIACSTAVAPLACGNREVRTDPGNAAPELGRDRAVHSAWAGWGVMELTIPRLNRKGQGHWETLYGWGGAALRTSRRASPR